MLERKSEILRILKTLFILYSVILMALFLCTSKPDTSMDSANTVESLYHFYIDSGKLYKLNLITGDESTCRYSP